MRVTIRVEPGKIIDQVKALRLLSSNIADAMQCNSYEWNTLALTSRNVQRQIEYLNILYKHLTGVSNEIE